MSLKNNVALVTGAGSGIGRQISLTLAARGAHIAICDINMDGAEETKKEIEAAGGAEAACFHMDVTSEQEVNSATDAIAKKFGRIDTLVSNAGIQIVHPIEEFPYDAFRKLVAIHLDGAFLTTKAAVKYMYPQKSGSLIYM